MKKFSDLKEGDTFYYIRIYDSKILNRENGNALMELKAERIVKNALGTYASIAFTPQETFRNRTVAVTVNLDDDVHTSNEGIDPISMSACIYATTKEKAIKKTLELIDEHIKKTCDVKTKCDNVLDDLLIAGSMLDAISKSFENENINLESIASMAL